MTQSLSRNPLFLKDEELDQSLERLLLTSVDLGRPLAAASPQRLHERDFLLLFFIKRRPESTMAELARLLAVPKQNLSRDIAGLVDSGLITRRAAEDDRRKRLLVLSEEGERLLEAVTTAQKRLLTRAFRLAGPQAVEGFLAVTGLLGAERELRAA